MPFIVAKPFATRHRRFAAGAPVTATDITGPIGFAAWRAGGYIVEAPPEPAPDPADHAPAPTA